MSTTVLESDSSTTTLNLTDSGGSGGGVTNVGVLNKTDLASSAHENVSNLASTSNIGPMGKKVKHRPTPYSKPSILLPADRRQRKKKKITWQPDESLKEVHYFELIPDERTNVSRQLLQFGAANASNIQLQTPKEKEIPERFFHIDPHRPGVVVERQRESELDRRPIRYPKWRLILIDLPAELPTPGWNSFERSAQAERETYVLGAIDLPGQPSTIDEPDTLPMTTKGHVKVIPFENIDGMYTEYPDVYKLDLVNGIGGPRNSRTYMENFLASQKSQLLSDQVQGQLQWLGHFAK